MHRQHAEPEQVTMPANSAHRSHPVGRTLIAHASAGSYGAFASPMLHRRLLRAGEDYWQTGRMHGDIPVM